MYIVLAVLAAAAFALGSVLKHRSAQDLSAPPEHGTGFGTVLAESITHRLWLLAAVVDAAGFTLQVLALALGPLDVVQPLVTLNVVLALLLSRNRPGRAVLGWSLALVGAIGALGVIGSQGHLPADVAPDGAPALVAVVLTTLALLACLWVGRLAPARWVAVVCGFGACLSYAASAGLIKVLSVRADVAGLVGLATAWPLYALVLSGGVGLLLCQLGFRAGPLHQSLPAASAIDPVASVVLGIAVFDEPLGGGVPGAAAFAVVLAVLVLAVVRVSRTLAAAVVPEAAARPDRSRAASGRVG